MKQNLQSLMQSKPALLIFNFFLLISVAGWSQTYHTLSGGSFTQDWTNTGLITTANVWTGVPSIIGYGGNDITASTGVNPQTLLGEGTITINVQANQSNPNTNSSGGFAEFQITNPVVAFQGSGTSDAPNLVIFLNTIGVTNIQIQYNLRDIDGSADNAIQQVALQYRIGTTGNFTDIPTGYIADASSGPSLATLVTPVSVTLPVATENQSQLQLRIITSNAGGSDEWIGIDDILVTGSTGLTAPIVTTPTATNITDMTADLGGNIVSDGGATLTERGTVWSTSTGVLITDNKLIDGGIATGIFSHTRSSLPSGTQIFYKAYAINSYGTTLSTEGNFYTLSLEPTSHATSFTAAPISQTQIDLAFSPASSIVNGAGYLILQRTGAAPTGVPVDATGYVVGGTIGDASVAAIVSNTSTTTINITGLAAGTQYYFSLFPYNWDGSVVATDNYRTSSLVPTINATTNAALDATSEISGPALGSQPDPVLLSSLATSDATAVRVFDMDVYDYGTDGQPTKITQVTIKPGATNEANWPNTIQGVKLSLDGGTTFATIGIPVITAASIVIPIVSGNLVIPNNDAKTLSLYVYLKSSGLIDNQILDFKVDDAAASHGFIADATGSTFLTNFTAAPVSKQMLIDVASSKLKFIVQPTNAFINATMSPAVTIEATDANNNRDLDNTGVVALSSSGTMTGPVSATLTNGLGTFGSIVHTATGSGLTLTASLSGITDAVSNTFIITLVPVLTELVVPKYIAAKTASSANYARTPFAVCLKIENLLPNTAYDIKPQVELSTGLATSYGAGNIWGATGFGTASVLNAFTTDNTGNSGPFWVYIQPTGNASRFGAGQVHTLRIGYTVNGSTMPGTPNFVGTKTITALDINTAGFTPSTTDDGAYIKGSADPSVTGKYVLLYDNVAGTGDPLFSYQIRQAIPTSTFTDSLPNAIKDVYIQSGTSSIGDYPAVVPIGANNPNGVQRIEARNADNTINFFNTDDDGIWPSGVNTTSLTRKALGIITVTDAPLKPTNKTLNLTAYLESLYNAGIGKMNQAQKSGAAQFADGIADVLTVELHDATTPFATAYTFADIDLNINGTLAVNTVPSAVSGNYYIVLKHRNSVELWSATAVSFSGSTIDYNFSTSASQAYGNAMKDLGSGVFGMFAGDVNQDGIVDSGDMVVVDNDAANFITGYVANDVNGDGNINAADLLLLNANATGFVGKKMP